MKVAIAVVLVLGATAARAEQPPNQCRIDWWEVWATAPTEVLGLPPEPRLLLPVIWSDRQGQPPDLTDAAVRVDILDEAERPVAGALGAGSPGLATDWSSGLDRMLWWRPSAPLASGLYHARVSVADPPVAESGNCWFAAFERTVAFEVVAEAPVEPPRAATDVRATVFQAEELAYSTQGCDAEGRVRCQDRADVCCSYLWPGDTFAFETIVDVEVPVPGGGMYEALEVVFDDEVTRWIHPVPDDRWSDREQFFPPPYRRPYDVTRCVTTRLWSLHELAVVSTSNDCARSVEAERLAHPGPIVCDEDRCQQEPDPVVEPAVEPGPDDGATDGGEPASDDSATAPPDADVADPDPVTETRDGGGCAGGPGPAGPIGGLAGLLAPLVVILAGGRSSRFGRDKARVPVLGAPSLDRVRAAAEDALGAGAVAVHDGPAGGPLGAILESFARWPGRDLVVLACDLPLIDADTIARLAAPLEGADARVARVAGRAQPLAALYRTTAEAPLRAAWEAGERAIVRALDRLRIAWLDEPEARLVDFDTPAELAAIEGRAGGDQTATP